MEPPDQEPPVWDYEPPARPLVPMYRRIFPGLLLLVGLAAAILGLLATNESARVNILVAAFSLIVLAAVIRFQHIRF